MSSGTTGAGGVAVAVGIVVTEGRIDLISRLGGSNLLSSSRATLARAEVTQISTDMAWASVQDLGLPVLLHDPLCPLLAASVLAGAVADSVTGRIIVGCRPVTDTIKVVTGGRVGQSVDRDLLVEIASPIVLPPHVVATLTDWPDTADFALLVTSLREQFPVRFVEVPALGRRVDDESALRVLTAVDELRQG